MLRVKAKVVLPFFCAIILHDLELKFFFKMKKLLTLCAMSLALFSCNEEIDIPTTDPTDPYVYILNEGNFQKGNSDISTINYKGEVSNKLFETYNQRPLGDVGQSIAVMGDNFYVPVSGSNKIEVLDYSTFKQVETISSEKGEFSAPQYVQFLSGSEAIVSNLYTNQMTLIDVVSHEIIGTVDVGAGTGRMIASSTHNYIAKYTPVPAEDRWNYDAIMVMDSQSKSIITEIPTVGMTATPLMADHQKRFWAMTGTEFVCIDIYTNTIVKSLALPQEVIDNRWTSRCTISGNGTAIVFSATVAGMHNIYMFDTSTSSNIGEPSYTVRNDVVQTLYNMAISPDGNLWIADAVDYTQSGKMVVLNIYNGAELETYEVGVLPNFMIFRY